MALTEYKKKRHFNKTTEPVGVTKKVKSAGLIFVVQKHHASHLHYDFRLEMEGVLKSWAVPKGPSMNPADKRLAMQVEDHPYAYKDFEGTIPEGNYGAGNVIVWDTGTYTAANPAGDNTGEAQLMAQLKKGLLNITLHGKKLKGEFSLIKIKGEKGNAWLLIKKEDKYATTADVLKKNKSVLSRATIEAMDKKSLKSKTTKTAKGPKPVKKKPELIKPMLAESTDSPFDDKEWIFETKFDGYRALALCNGKGNVELYSRNLKQLNTKYFPLVAELEKIAHPCLLDGEVVILDNNGRSHFQLLQNYQSTGQGNLNYFVFDLLSLDGHDTTQLPLIQRKELLQALLNRNKSAHIIFSKHVQGNGINCFEQAKKQSLEGIMAKQAHSPYLPAQRSRNWLKIKIHNEQEAVIAGITAPKGGRHFFGSLLLGVYDKGILKYIGHCGTGFDDATLKSLYHKFKPLFIKTCPFNEIVKPNGKVQWLSPKLVCQVKFTEWTEDGSMRHPVFLGLRDDKKAAEVKRETPAVMKTKASKTKNAVTKASAATKGDLEIKVGKNNLKLTNQSKIYWPKEGFTKGDLVNYYTQVAPFILPYLKDRPQSMHRFPNGISKPGFFQKDVEPASIPDWLHTEKIYSDSNKGYIDYLICNDKATLIYMANLGCIEINPWNSKYTKPENPDWLVIDLDPEDIDFGQVVKVALKVKDVLDGFEIDSYCKTSGGRGLHIYVPLAAKYNYEIAKNFAHLVAQKVNAALPDITSLERSPKKRQKRVYLDFLQNNKAQTLAAPYSVRPKPGAPVSTPLLWREVNAKLNPAQFTMQNTLKRLDKVNDLWKPVLGKAANLQRALKKVSA